MPNPLFPYVWSYNNQTVDVLANDITEYVVNPSPKVIPVCGAGEFVDSTLWDDSQSLRTRYQITPSFLEDKGFILDYATNKYQFGDYGESNNSTIVNVNDGTGTILFASRINGLSTKYFGVDCDNEWLKITTEFTETTAGSAAAKFIKIDVAGTPYKIQLLNV